MNDLTPAAPPTLTTPPAQACRPTQKTKTPKASGRDPAMPARF